MNGYAKIRLVNTTKSRSMDFSDLSSFHQTPKPLPNTASNPTSKPQETKQIKSTNSTNDSFSEQEDEAGNEDRFVKVLRRSSSVSSAASSHRLRFDKQSTALQTAVKKAFSMKRSSSVSERYCRIHDQSVTLASSPIDDEGGMDTMQTRSVKKKEKRGKILKACKRLFGL